MELFTNPEDRIIMIVGQGCGIGEISHRWDYHVIHKSYASMSKVKFSIFQLNLYAILSILYVYSAITNICSSARKPQTCMVQKQWDVYVHNKGLKIDLRQAQISQLEQVIAKLLPLHGFLIIICD